MGGEDVEMLKNLSPFEIIPCDEQFVNDSLESVLRRAETLQNDSETVRHYLVKHLLTEQKAEQAHYTATCGTYLLFKQYHNAEKTLTLDRANFCKHPMCPVCAWRRHLKYSKIIERTLDLGRYKNLYHIVLGVPNVVHLEKKDLMRLKERGATFVKQKLSCLGYISNLEVVCHGRGIHPHLHILIETPEFIKNSREYVIDMSKKWMKHYIKGLDNKAEIEARYNGFTFFLTGINRGDRQGVAQELTKYIVKGDFTSDDGEHIATIAKAIKGVRKMSSAGNFKQNMTRAKGELLVESADKFESLSKEQYDILIYKFINGKYEKETIK